MGVTEHLTKIFGDQVTAKFISSLFCWVWTRCARLKYMTWRVPRYVYQARAPSRNSTKYRADELCGNLISEYFCWMLGGPHCFFGRSLPFVILSIILKHKKICTWEVLLFLIYYSNRVDLVHGYRCARLSPCFHERCLPWFCFYFTEVKFLVMLTCKPT